MTENVTKTSEQQNEDGHQQSLDWSEKITRHLKNFFIYLMNSTSNFLSETFNIKNTSLQILVVVLLLSLVLFLLITIIWQYWKYKNEKRKQRTLEDQLLKPTKNMSKKAEEKFRRELRKSITRRNSKLMASNKKLYSMGDNNNHDGRSWRKIATCFCFTKTSNNKYEINLDDEEQYATLTRRVQAGVVR